jgi:hypothetical protein
LPEVARFDEADHRAVPDRIVEAHHPPASPELELEVAREPPVAAFDERAEPVR